MRDTGVFAALNAGLTRLGQVQETFAAKTATLRERRAQLEAARKDELAQMLLRLQERSFASSGPWRLVEEVFAPGQKVLRPA
jgi:hypothetical protein